MGGLKEIASVKWEGARGVVDVSSGALVWKGRHEKVKTDMVCNPALKEILEELVETLVKPMPK